MQYYFFLFLNGTTTFKHDLWNLHCFEIYTEKFRKIDVNPTGIILACNMKM